MVTKWLQRFCTISFQVVFLDIWLYYCYSIKLLSGGNFDDKKIILAVVSLLLCATFLNAAEAGKIVGGANHDVPSWFKLSFLDITDDAQEAQKNNKHLMIFMDLDGCPYCAQMLSESFFPKK